MDLAAEAMTVCIEDSLLIPASAASLEGFREWLRSEQFPEKGRIDYLQGRIELDMAQDMAQEDLYAHVMVKGKLYFYLEQTVLEHNLGQAFPDGVQFTSPRAGLSCKPDVLFVSWEALHSGRARLVPTSPDRPQRFMEIEGEADLVVEVLSDGSVGKDTKRLPPLYAKARVRELWLCDARKATLDFKILHLHGSRYRAAPKDSAGFQESRVLGRAVRLGRQGGPLPGVWVYVVETAPWR